MAEKKVTKKAAAPKAEEAKKSTVKKAAAPKKDAAKAIVVNAENAGFKAGDVYQALAGLLRRLCLLRRLLRQLRSARRRLCWVWVGSSRRARLAAADDKVTLA